LRLLQGNVDFVVLVPYMQIVSGAFIRDVGVPIINIHHSFLPARTPEPCPSEVYVTTDPTISVPIEREADYPLLTAAYTTLASDGADINILAFHQFKPLDNGLGYQTRRVIPPEDAEGAGRRTQGAHARATGPGRAACRPVSGRRGLVRLLVVRARPYDRTPNLLGSLRALTETGAVRVRWDREQLIGGRAIEPCK
jgi:Formyl transferase